MTKRKYVLLIIICGVILTGKYLLSSSLPIPGCVSFTILTKTGYATPTFSEDGSHIALAQYVYKYRPVVGICKFPDGGTDRPVQKSIRVYTLALTSHTPSLLTEIKLPRTEPENILGYNNFKIRGWQNGALVLTYGLTSNTSTPTRSYMVQGQSGQWQELTDTSHPLLRKHWSAGNFSPIDTALWVTSEPSVGVATYRDGYHLDNKGTPYQSGTAQLVETILTPNDIQKLDMAVQ